MPGPSLLLAAAAHAEGVRERAAAILARREYQGELPGVPDALHLPPLGFLASALRVLVYAAVAIALVLAVKWLVEQLRRGAADAEAAAAPPAADAIARIPEGAALRLAAQGRYGEAIHALLLETLEALSRAARLAPSLTSREIVRDVPLAPRAREALGGLVAAVEVSYFGGEPPGPGDYEVCLDRFHAFLETYRSAA